MACSEMETLIDLYVDDTLPEEARARVERHAMTCADCAWRLRATEQARAHLRDAYSVEPASPAFRERMAARLHDEFGGLLVHSDPSAERQIPLPLFRELAE